MQVYVVLEYKKKNIEKLSLKKKITIRNFLLKSTINLSCVSKCFCWK